MSEKSQIICPLPPLMRADGSNAEDCAEVNTICTPEKLHQEDMVTTDKGNDLEDASILSEASNDEVADLEGHSHSTISAETALVVYSGAAEQEACSITLNGVYKPDPIMDDEEGEFPGYYSVACPLWLWLFVCIIIGIGLSLLWPVERAYFRHPPTEGLLLDNGSKSDGSYQFEVVCASEDAVCNIIMGAIGPSLTESMASFEEGSCQQEARIWLRSNKDILVFTPERVRQRYALAVFYCETGGHDWLENNMWLSDLHECDWYTKLGKSRSSCNRVEQMTVLRMDNNQLHGTIPPELSFLTSLFELTLSNNFLHGSIPPELGRLTELDTLNLGFNMLQGKTPDLIWQFEDMVYLDISFNALSGTIPSDLGTNKKMNNLEKVFAGNNNFRGTIPASLGNIQRLHLGNNAISGTIPDSILRSNPQLEQLYLNSNSLSGTVNLSPEVEESHGQASDEYIEGCKEFYFEDRPILEVDCDQVACDCCGCTGA